MDWVFKNKVGTLENPGTEIDLNQNDDLEDLFLQHEHKELSEVEFKNICDRTDDLLIRSRLYALLDFPGGDTRIAHKNGDSRNYYEDVTEADVVNSLYYNKGDESELAYDLCLEYLVKSNLKLVNSTNTKKSTVKSTNSQSSVRRYSRKLPAGRQPLVLKLRSLTKRVKFLRQQNLENTPFNEEDFTSSLSSSSDGISSSSAVGDYETEDTSFKYRYHRNDLKRNRKVKVPYQNYYTRRRQHLLELERRSKSKKGHRRKIGSDNILWPVDCCSNKPQLRNATHVKRSILEFSVIALFLFICVTVLMDALQFNEHFEDSDFESIL